MAFTDSEQQEHRAAFVRDCRQKAWGAACHADWIGKQLDGLVAELQRYAEEDRAIEAEIKTLETALDYHTVVNREKRKELQEQRNGLAKQVEGLGGNIRQGQQAMQNLLASVESNLALGKYAKGWQYREVSSSANATD